MNTTILNKSKVIIPEPKEGDIYRDKDDNELFILATPTAATYVAISLRDGNRWADPKHDPESAVRNLQFVGRGAKISVEA